MAMLHALCQTIDWDPSPPLLLIPRFDLHWPLLTARLPGPPCHDQAGYVALELHCPNALAFTGVQPHENNDPARPRSPASWPSM